MKTMSITMLLVAISMAAPATENFYALDAYLDLQESQLFVLWLDPGGNGTPIFKYQWSVDDEEWIKIGNNPYQLKGGHTINRFGEHYLVSDAKDKRIVLVNKQGEELADSRQWEIEFNFPNDAEPAPIGEKRILICDNHPWFTPGEFSRLLEIDFSGEITMEILCDDEKEQIHDADYIDQDNFIFCLSKIEEKIVKVNRAGEEVWSHQNTNWEWLRSGQWWDGYYYVAEGTCVYRISEDHDEQLIASGFQNTYNLHIIDDDILVCDENGVSLIDFSGNIIWFLDRNPMKETEKYPFSVEEWGEWRSLGYIE